jgi:hypothetical protein
MYQVTTPDLVEKQKSAAGPFHTTLSITIILILQILIKKVIVKFHEIEEAI